jgi:hypothetical protein
MRASPVSSRSTPSGPGGYATSGTSVVNTSRIAAMPSRSTTPRTTTQPRRSKSAWSSSRRTRLEHTAPWTQSDFTSSTPSLAIFAMLA